MDDEQNPPRKGRPKRGSKYSIPEELDKYAANDEGAASIFNDGLFDDPNDIDEPPCPEDCSPQAWAAERLPLRLSYLRGIMSRGLYDPRTHDQTLASKWGVSLAKTRQMASEADRQLSLLQGRSNEISSEFFSEKLLRVAARAEQAGSFMAAISGIAKAAELVVAPKTQKVDISVAYAGMTPSELRDAYQKELEAAKKLGLLGSGKDIPDAEFEDNGDRVTPVAPEGGGDE